MMTSERQEESAIGYKVVNLGDGRGRNAGYPASPAQIPACATNALGSSLEYERQSGNKDVDVRC